MRTRRIPTVTDLDTAVKTITEIKDNILKQEDKVFHEPFINAIVSELIRSYEYIFSLENMYEHQGIRKDKIVDTAIKRLEDNNKLSERLRYVRETNKHLWEKIKLLKFALKECQQKDCDPMEMLQPLIKEAPWQTDGDRMRIVYTDNTDNTDNTEYNPYWPLDYETDGKTTHKETRIPIEWKSLQPTHPTRY